MENTSLFDEIVNDVETNIIGRLANRIGSNATKNTQVLLSFVQQAGGGNHLEIGTLFGGSAIAVALLKNKLNHSGIVFCVDPLDGYYPQYQHSTDKKDGCGKEVTPKTLFDNISNFEVGNRIAVMRAYSTNIALPMMFSTAFIDGDHHDSVPFNDWIMAKDKVTRYVVFDNYSPAFPDVQRACGIAEHDPNWKCVYKDDTVFVVEKIG